MARQISEQLTSNPVLDTVDELKGLITPKIEKLKQQLESPDNIGKAEAYFSSLSSLERKKFLIDEMGEAARVLAILSDDIEQNLHFYNTAPDKNVKQRLQNFFFPDKARQETKVQKLTRVAAEIGTGKITKPNLATKTGASERWRRRVMRGIEIFLEERYIMQKIEADWNHPSKMVRDELWALVLFNFVPRHEPEAIFTPLGLIIVLHDDDYDMIVDSYLQDSDSPQQSRSGGAALMEHKLYPALNGRVTFIRETNSLEDLHAIIRHELFHLYFNRFIRKEKLSKVQEFIITEGKINTVPLAKKLIAETLINLQSLILEETSAYLFNTSQAIDPDRANGFLWEEVITRIEQDLGPNVSPDILRSVLWDARVAQGAYLRQARTLQSSVSTLLEHFEIEFPDAQSEEIKRYFLFLMSQWGPQRMAQFTRRLGFDEEAIEKEEKILRDGLQNDMRKLFVRLTSGQRDKSTERLLDDVKSEAAWLYSGETLLDLWNLCWYLLTNNGLVEDINPLLRSMENSIVARQTTLTPKENEMLKAMVSMLKNNANEKLRRHAPILKRLQKQYKPS